MLYDNKDISNGVEAVHVSAKNRYNFDSISPFRYIKQLDVPAHLTKRFRSNLGCDCSNCTNYSCKCCKGDDYYTKFCDSMACSCSAAACCNRMGDLLELKVPLQVFYVNPQKKWGIRCEENIEKGKTLFEYTGVLMDNNDNESNADNDYLFLFEHDDHNYMIDAREKGNVTRFINHACLPNLRPLLMIGDGNIPHIGFITTRDIPRGEELTFNYGSLWWDFKWGMKCACNSPDCMYPTE